MATTAQALLSSVNCHTCYSASPYQLQAMLVALVRQWVLALNPSAVTDAQTLLTQAACHGCNAANPYELQMMLVALMIQVVNNGGGTGNGFVFGNYGFGQPNFVPASGTGAAFDIDAGRPWYYYNGQWN